MNISNIIADMIIEMIARDGEAEIRRNEFASRVGCVPSQINYVLTSRFTPEQGFIVESRRGGGGYIKITRVGCSRRSMIMHLVNSVGRRIDDAGVRANILNLLHQDFITERDAGLLLSAMSRSALRAAPPECADYIRADIFKQMLLAISEKAERE